MRVTLRSVLRFLGREVDGEGLAMDDSLIIELLLSRDEEALVQLASKYGARLLRVAQSIVTDVPTAEECVNDSRMRDHII